MTKARGLTCILHIGHTKTGSTSIQQAFASHRKALSERGVLYPVSPGWSNHALIPAAAAPPAQRESGVHPAFWAGESPERRVARFLREFPAEVEAARATHRLVVLSSEQCIHMLPDAASVGRLKTFLDGLFDETRVVIYLRRQDEHYASAYSQRLRDGVVERPKLPDPHAPSARYYDFARLLRTWAGAFGEAAVVPRVFDRRDLVGGDVVDDLLALCGASGAVPADAAQRRANPSLSLEGQAVVLAVGRAMQRGITGTVPGLGNPIWRHLNEVMTEISPGSGWSPSGPESAAFMAHYADGNEWIRSRWFPDRAELFRAKPSQGNGRFPLDEEVLPLAVATIARMSAWGLLDRVSGYLDLANAQIRAGDAEAGRRTVEAAIALDEAAPSPRIRMAELVGRSDPELARHHLDVAARRVELGNPHYARVRKIVGGGAPADTPDDTPAKTPAEPKAG